MAQDWSCGDTGLISVGRRVASGKMPNRKVPVVMSSSQICRT